MLWLTVLVALSCGGHKRELAQVERLLETNPAQADSLLSTIGVPDGKRMQALYNYEKFYVFIIRSFFANHKSK